MSGARAKCACDEGRAKLPGPRSSGTVCQSRRRSGVIGALLLAAGSSERFGSDKLLATLPDLQPIAAATAATLVFAVARVVAVVRPGSDALREALERCGAEVVVCPNASEGMGTSLAWGMATACDWDGWIVALADMPFVQSRTVRAVAQAIATGAPIAAPHYRGRRGHPVGFSRRHREALLDLRGDRGARDIVAACGDQILLVDCDDPGVIEDIDTPFDLPRRAAPTGTRDCR
jgi:molybdenum cofactor cytidylyltransferase